MRSGCTAAAERELAAGVGGHGVERPRVIGELVVELPGHEVDARRDVGSRHAVVERDQPVRVAVRQRVQEHPIHDREDRHVGADGEREREHGCASKRRTAAQHPGGVAQVARDVFEPGEDALFAIGVCCHGQSAKFERRVSLGFVVRHAGAQVVRDVRVEVAVQLVGKIGVGSAP